MAISKEILTRMEEQGIPNINLSPFVLSVIAAWRQKYREDIEYAIRIAEYRVIQDNSPTNQKEVKRLKQILYRKNYT